MGIRLKGQTSGYVEIKAPATAADNTLTFPNGNGSSNQVLTTDGSGGLTFAAPQVSTDTTPQLGGNLDVNGNDIVTTSNGDIDLDPNGSGQVVFKGNATRGSGAVKLNCENNSHGILVKGPPHSAGASYTLTLPNDTGTSGQLLTTNGSGVTSWSTVSSGASFEATADGAIANGDPCVVNSDGTVSAVAATSQIRNVGSKIEFTANSPDEISMVYDPKSKKVVLVYRDTSDSNKGKAVLGTVNNASISWTAVSTFETNRAYFPSIVYDEEYENFVVAYLDLDDEDGKAFVLSVSGSLMTFGTKLVFDSDQTQGVNAVYDPSARRTVVVWRDNAGGTNNCVCNVLKQSPSGTLTAGSMVTATSNNIEDAAVVYDASTKKIVIFGKDGSQSNRGSCVVGDVSGDSVTFGTVTSVTGGDAIEHASIAYDASAKRIVFFMKDEGNSNKPRVQTGLVNGLEIEVSSETHIATTQSNHHAVVYDPSVGKSVFFYTNYDDNNDGYYVSAVVNAKGITADPIREFLNSNDVERIAAVYNEDQKRIVVAYEDEDSDGGSQSIRIEGPSTNLTDTNYIGVADAAYSDSATATIQVASAVDDAQSGLTIGKKYFVQRDGSLAPVSDRPAVFAGTAVSATKLIVKG